MSISVRLTRSITAGAAFRARQAPRSVGRPRGFRSNVGLAGFVAGLATCALLSLGGTGNGIEATLGAMGFDADRARLIMTLAVGAAGATTAGFTSRGWRPGVAVSVVAMALTFGQTFVRETQAAVTAPGADFDPVGWAAVLVGLLVAGLSVGWAAATLGAHARGGVAAAVAVIRLARRDPTHRAGGLRTVAAGIAIVASLAVGLPTLGEMLNYGSDAPMHRGGPAFPGILTTTANLTSPAPIGSALAVPSASPSSTSAAMVDGPLPGSSISIGATSPFAPWAATPPSGPGRVVPLQFSAPWTGGVSRTAAVDVYLPAGYDATPTRRYPVVYSAPWGFSDWNKGVQLGNVLDRLIAGGGIAPEIFVFISQYGAAYPSSECANARDGRQWFDRYIVDAVVPFVDGHYRTIASPSARSLLGYSEGAYCAATLLLRHPDLFGQATAISGYYHAAPRAGATSNAWRVFGGDPDLIAAASPVLLVASVPPAVRDSMFVVLVGQPSEPFFGSEYADFAAALAVANVPRAIVPLDGSGHSWWAVRTTIGPALRLMALRQVHTGVFGLVRCAPERCP